MPKQFWIVLALAAAVYMVLHVEWRRHRRALSRIAIRIHVNGSRGKSSVTRLIAAALRQHGVRTVAKTTGTVPRLILPDGSEEPVARDGKPSIGELTWAIGRAARLDAEAVVFECMAVDPGLQHVAENAIVEPTITVVTNARLDHTDVQGTTYAAIARSFAVRRAATLVTADPIVADIHRRRVEAEGGRVVLAGVDLVRSTEVAALSYVEHPDNVAVALAVAELLGIPREVAMSGITGVEPDPGAAFVAEIPDRSGPFSLVNLFAANDPDSTFRALGTVEQLHGIYGRPLFLFTSRGDRTARSAEFAAAFAEHSESFSDVIVWGEKTGAMTRRLRARGLASTRVVDAGSCPPSVLTDLVVSRLSDERVVVGMGNIVGAGQQWLAYLAGRLEPMPAPRSAEAAV